ncbi:Uncharacterised protein at_DN1052 [Pycnogonum litorale]
MCFYHVTISSLTRCLSSENTAEITISIFSIFRDLVLEHIFYANKNLLQVVNSVYFACTEKQFVRVQRSFIVSKNMYQKLYAVVSIHSTMLTKTFFGTERDERLSEKQSSSFPETI